MAENTNTERAGAHNMIALSPLPEADHHERVYGGHGQEIVYSYYSEHQMREYARQEVFRAEEAWQARASLSLPAAGQEPVALPNGWVPCTISFDGDAEEVAYGPKVMMDRLAKWLGKHFAQLAAPSQIPDLQPLHDLLYAAQRSTGDAQSAAITAARVELSHIRSSAPQPAVAAPYSMDADPSGIRALVADTITGALAFGAQGVNKPPEGHWLTPFWEAAIASTQLAAAGWLPIETAPKDGSHVLLHGDGRTTFGHWCAPSDTPRIKYQDGFAPEPEWEDFEPFWASWDGGFTDEHPPTHWMPLPPAPSTEGEGNG